ncbi:hypothetical protein P9112_011602 [Eukaryota sp. TZLM1-RC]
MQVFITVGTTSFDELIRALDSISFYNKCVEIGFNNVIFQIGNSTVVPDQCHVPKCIKMSWFRFQSSLHDILEKSDLVITAGGAGTISESLKLNKRVIVAINRTLLHNHQMELASKYQDLNHLAVVDTPHLVPSRLDYVMNHTFTPLQEPEPDVLLRHLKSRFFDV